MDFNQKQIWMLDFDPSIGHEYKKVRPALIIENPKYIESGNLITVLPISAKVKKRDELDVYLPKDKNNRLMKNSVIKTKQISSFDKRRFIKYIGDCDGSVFREVYENIRSYLSINNENVLE